MRYAHVVEGQLRRIGCVQAHLRLQSYHLVAGRVRGHDKGGNAALALFRIGNREDQGEIGILARRDELLAAIDDIAVPVAHRPGGQGARVRATLGLGQGKGAKNLALGQGAQITLLLRQGAKFQYRHAADGIMATHHDSHGAIGGGNFLQCHGVGYIVESGAAPFRRHRHAHQAQFAHGREDIPWKMRIVLPRRRIGGNLFRGECPRHIADHDLFVSRDHSFHTLSDSV